MDKVITVAATVVIAFMAIVNATVSIYQWQELQRANKINAQNTYEIQRPFIYASRMELSPVIVGSSLSYDLDPVIFNGGNSAPKTLAAYINYYSTSDPINPDYTFPDLVGNCSPGAVWPHCEPWPFWWHRSAHPL